MSLLKKFRFLPKLEIEAIATQVLQTSKPMQESALDPSRVAEFLGLDLVWDQINSERGEFIAGRLLPLEHLIEINEELAVSTQGLAESTIAHEIGHWVLHIDQRAVERYQKLARKGVILPPEPLICRDRELTKAREWQAQYFASCLLMPREKLATASEGKNLQRWGDRYQVAAVMGVSISNLIHRLRDLGWYQEHILDKVG